MLRHVFRLCMLMFLLKCNQTARILCVYPAPFDSHQIVLRVLTDEMARQGHQLVVVTSLPHSEPTANITDIDLHSVSYTTWEKGYEEAAKFRDTYAFRDAPTFWNMAGGILDLIFDQLIRHPQLQGLIKDKSQNFDLIMVEACADMGSVLRARFNVPIIQVSSFTVSSETFGLMGAETNNFLYPALNVILDWNVSFWQKIWSLLHHAKIKILHWGYDEAQNEIIKKYFGEQSPKISELKQGVGMLFLSVHRFWDNNRPAPIGTVLYLGGIHLKAPKSLPMDLKAFVDNSKHGVVFVSLGSKLKPSQLPARTLRVMTQVFSKLPYDFIWKWDAEEMPGKPNNVRLEKWLPQNDLLHHPKVRAFVSHGGLQSTQEAISARVPLVGLPVLQDQWLNARLYEHHAIGKRLDIDFMDEDEFRNAIVAVVQEKKYRENIDRVARIMSEQRVGVADAARRAHILATRARAAAVLRAPLADTSFTHFYMLDMLFVAAMSIVVAVA